MSLKFIVHSGIIGRCRKSPRRYCDVRLNKVAVSRVVTGIREKENEHWKQIIERPSVLNAEEMKTCRCCCKSLSITVLKTLHHRYIYTACPTPVQ